MIVPVTSTEMLPLCVAVIRQAFETVASDFNLTPENCPTHPFFISLEKIRVMYEKGIFMYTWKENSEMVGFVAIEQPDSDNPWWYVEKLAVAPSHRHKGIGKKFMNFAVHEIEKRGGTHISVALIDEQVALKNWYLSQGFSIVGTENFKHLPFTVCFMEYNLLQFNVVSGSSPVIYGLIVQLDQDLRERYGEAKIHDIDLEHADETGVTFAVGFYGK
jgi:diamine N-acetyltransferase